MGGNYYNDFRCDLFDFARGFIDFVSRDVEEKEGPNVSINITNNITINNNNTIVDSQNRNLSTAIVFY